MFVAIKKIISCIGVLGIVTGGLSLNSLAVGPLNSDKTELGEVGLCFGCSGSHNPKFSNELTDEENDKLVEEVKSLGLTLVTEGNKSEYLRKKFKNLEKKFKHDIFSNLARLRKLLQGSYKNLVRAKIELKDCKIKNKRYMNALKSVTENQQLFDDQCKEFRTELQIADNMLSQLKENFYEYAKQQNNEVRKKHEKYLELEAKYYNLNKFDEYNRCFSNYLATVKPQSLSAIAFFTFERTADDLKIKGLNKFLELLEETLSQINWENQQAKMSNDVDLLDLFKELSKSESDIKPWVQTLHKYITISDENIQIEGRRSSESSKMNIINGRAGQAREDFYVIKYKLQNEILAKYNAEHAKPKVEVGASVTMEYDNNQFENDIPEEVKSVEKSSNSISESDVKDPSKGIRQVKIDKSSDYNKEKKLRDKEEKKKKKKIANQGALKVKNSSMKKIDVPAESNVLIMAGIVKTKEDINQKKEDINQKDENIANDISECTLSNPSEESNNFTQSDSNSEKINTSVELSSIDSEGDSESTDSNLEMSDEEFREKLVGISKGFDEFIKDSVKLSASQSDDEFIKSLLNTTEN